MKSKPVSAEYNWPEWSLPPPEGDHGHSALSLSADHRQKSDNMVLQSECEGSTPSASGTLSGQKEIIHNTPLAKEDHLTSNAAALVTGRPLVTFTLDVVASNRGTEQVTSQQSKQPTENDFFSKDNFNEVEKNLQKV